MSCGYCQCIAIDNKRQSYCAGGSALLSLGVKVVKGVIANGVG